MVPLASVGVFAVSQVFRLWLLPVFRSFSIVHPTLLTLCSPRSSWMGQQPIASQALPNAQVRAAELLPPPMAGVSQTWSHAKVPAGLPLSVPVFFTDAVLFSYIFFTAA